MTAAEILEQVAAAHGVTVDEMRGNRKTLGLPMARRAAIVRMHNELGMGPTATARQLGGMDHASVIYHLRKARDGELTPATPEMLAKVAQQRAEHASRMAKARWSKLTADERREQTDAIRKAPRKQRTYVECGREGGLKSAEARREPVRVAERKPEPGRCPRCLLLQPCGHPSIYDYATARRAG